MREIEFRGKSVAIISEGIWVYGLLNYNSNLDCYTVDGSMVDINSVGQFSGKRDMKNDVKIYEGDILKTEKEIDVDYLYDANGEIDDVIVDKGYIQIGIVGFTSCSFSYKTLRTLQGEEEDLHIPIDWLENYEVIGNVTDNPELLEQ